MKTRLAVTFGSVLFLCFASAGMACAQNPVPEGHAALPQAPVELTADAPDLGALLLPFVPGEFPLSTAARPQPPYEFKEVVLLPSLAQMGADRAQQNARAFFERMSQDHKHRVEVTLQNGTRLEGRVVAVAAQQFTVRITKTKQETTISYADLRDWQLVPTNGEIAKNIFATAGLELAQIAMLPLMILAVLSGWDGC